ncbi:MAG: SGNH/GDSL hydrolase family protein [Polyangiaceae bacterium]
MLSLPRAAVRSLVVIALAACSTAGSDKGEGGGDTFHAGNAGIAGAAAASVGGGGGSQGGAAAGGSAPANGGSEAGGVGNPGGGGSSAGGAVSGNAGTATGGAASYAGAGAGSSGAAGSVDKYAPCPTSTASPCAVLPLGDSITEGFGSSGGGYRVELFRQALQNGKNLSFVGSLQNGPTTVQNQAFPKKHEGHGGYTIDTDTGHSGISGSITDQALANFSPNIVLLMIGTNDINGNIETANAPKRLGKLIDDIVTRAPNALVVVATIIAIANDGTNQKVQAYNAALPGLVSTRASAGKHVVLLDNYAAFSKDSSYRTTLMYDYLHPNDAGYVVLGRAMYEAIHTVLP